MLEFSPLSHTPLPHADDAPQDCPRTWHEQHASPEQPPGAAGHVYCVLHLKSLHCLVVEGSTTPLHPEATHDTAAWPHWTHCPEVA